MHREQHGLGMSSCAGGSTPIGIRASFPRQPFQLSGAVGVTENHLMAGAGEQGAEFSTHKTGSKNSDAHMPSL
jgi:hypothetical protein